MTTLTPARTYNQNHIPRKYTAGKRRLSIYWTWSYPWESNRDPAFMDNRFSTMTEVRRVAWPDYETPEWDAANFLQGIAGTLELFHRSTLSFQRIVGEVSDHPVAVFQRIDQAGYKQLYYWVGTDNARAIGFGKNVGFRTTGHRRPARPSDLELGDQEMAMVMPLEPDATSVPNPTSWTAASREGPDR